jgi:hypothetical protein
MRITRNALIPRAVHRCMLNRKIIWALAGHACLLASAAVAQTIPSPLPPVSFTRSYVFLPVGLAPSETAQVNVVNTTQVPTSISTLVPPPSPACTGTISFLNATGAVIGKPTPFTVAPGQVFSATLPYGSAGVTGGARAEIRGEVQLLATPSATANAIVFSPCSLSYSFETFDTSTGVTHVFNGAASATFAVPVPLQAVLRP